MNNCQFENFVASGDEDDSGLVLFYGNENENSNKLSLNDISIRNVTTNGSVIKIRKYYSKIYMKDLKVINSMSYGPFISISSESETYVIYIYFYILFFFILLLIYIVI